MDVGSMEVYLVTQRQRTHDEIMTVSPDNVPTHGAMLFNRDGLRNSICDNQHYYTSCRLWPGTQNRTKQKNAIYTGTAEYVSDHANIIQTKDNT